MATIKTFNPVLLFIFSVYFFLQSTFYGGAIAEQIYYLLPPKINGIPVSFSPYQFIPYLNFVLYCGVGVAGILFFFAAEPFVSSRMKFKRIISIPLTIVLVPLYLILLFIALSGILHIFDFHR